jgi:hypothetical protein
VAATSVCLYRHLPTPTHLSLAGFRVAGDRLREVINRDIDSHLVNLRTRLSRKCLKEQYVIPTVAPNNLPLCDAGHRRDCRPKQKFLGNSTLVGIQMPAARGD